MELEKQLSNVISGQHGFTRREFLATTGLAVGGLALAGCAPGQTTSKPGQIIVGTAGEAPTLFQNLEYQPQAYSIYDSILEYLVKADPLHPEKGPQPQLAVSWKQVSDKQWQFDLRQGVKFHNGEAWDAEAAKVNFDTVLKVNPPSPVLFRIGNFQSAEVKDKYTLLVNTKIPWATAPQGLSEVQFGAPANLTSVGPQQFAQKPIGTGMFKFADWKKGQQIVLEANGDYWGDKAKVQRLVFKGIADPSSRYAALRSGEIHMAENLSIDDVAAAKAKGLSVVDTPLAKSVLLIGYLIRGKKDGHPSGNPKVRQAMNYAIDRQTIIKSVLGGFGHLLGGQVTGSDAYGWNKTLSDYAYNPQKAKDLLKEAGYPNGADMGTLWMGEPAEWIKQSDFVQVLQTQFAAVGLKFEPKAVDESTFLRKALQEYSLTYWQVGGWQYYPVMDSAFALMWYDSDAFLKTGLGDANYDQVWRASDTEFNTEKRRALLEQAHQIVHDAAGAGFLWQHHKVFGLTTKIQGFVPTPDDRAHFKGVSIS